MLQPLERRLVLASLTPDVAFLQPVAVPLEDLPDSDNAAPIVGLIEAQADGKILTGGMVYKDGLFTQRLRVARFNEDGSPDTTFNGDGVSPAIDVPDAGAQVHGARQPDGKVLLAVATPDGVAVGRFNADGSIDASFGGGDGLATAGGFDVGNDYLLDANPHVAVTSGGQIVVLRGETGGNNLWATRFTSAGVLDTSFSGDGMLVIHQQDVAPAADPSNNRIAPRDVAGVAGNKVLILSQLGDAGDEPAQPALIQLMADGSFDSSFGGGDGKLPFAFRSGGLDEPMVGAMLVQGDGKIVVGGFQGGAALARFNADGTLDTGFGTNGVGIVATPRIVGVLDLAQDSQGRFVAVTGDLGSVARWTASGDPDVSFGTRGHEDAQVGLLLEIDAQDRLLTGTGNLVRFFTSPEDRPDVELGANGLLLITGEPGLAENTITVARVGDEIVVTRNGVESSFPAGDVQQLDVLTFDGDDAVTVTALLGGDFVLGDGANSLLVVAGGAQVSTGDGADTIATGEGFNNINSGGGDDAITLGAGPINRVHAGDGNDTVTGSEAGDTIFGEAGSDEIRGGGGNDVLFGGIDHPEFVRGFAIPQGGEPDGTNVIDGGDGDDLLIGAGNRDTLRGGAQHDTLVGFAGSDLLSGGGGKDKIAGLGGKDRIYGGAADDQLAGDNHDDRLVGGPGRDVLFGGLGSDRFFIADGEPDTVNGGTGEDVAEDADLVDALIGLTTAD